MIKLAKYLKPFLLLLVSAIILLFIQALTDLNLPNYLSNIVNVGLQQSGIENSAPSEVSKNGYELMQIFMSQEDSQTVNNSYDLKTDIYVLNTTNKEQIKSLNTIFNKASWGMMELSKDMNAKAKETEKSEPKTPNIKETYKMIGMLKAIPKQKIEQYLSTYSENNAAIASQVAVSLTKSFYEELGKDVSRMQTLYILKIGVIMLLIALIGGIATISVGFLSAKIAAGVARNIRSRVFKKVESFSNKEFDKFGAASLITRTTNDITQIQTLLVMGIRIVCYAPIIGIGGTIMAINKSASMSWIIATAVLLLIGMMLIIFSVAMPKFKIIQKLMDRLNLVARENLTGIMVIRAFGTQKFEEKRFDKANSDVTDVNLFVGRVMSFMMPAMMLIMNGTSLLIIWVGAGQISNSAMQIGDMMAYIQYSMQIIISFLMISMMFILVPRASVSALRIHDVLNTESSINDPKIPLDFISEKRGIVEFRNVCFRYENADEDVLHNISFTALPSQTTAFIGSTGSGKSTLVNLIPRFYDVTDGSIFVNGVDIRDVSQSELHNQIGFIPQKGTLFSGTVASNLKYGKDDATDEDIIEAIEFAQATDFISEKNEGINTPISQGGSNLSGGQKQRLSIARALVTKAPIFIFDDSFSALDFKTDMALRKALEDKTSGSTLLIVAQRVSTIMNADQIIVLDEGKIVGIGTHKELLKSCETYLEIASSQLSKEELLYEQ